jgi:outer membrane protein OmpA-like peptidoglycan-associated protein
LLRGILAGLTAAVLLAGGSAHAQSSDAPASSTESTRPATTTVLGDTGLWFVPTGEVVPAGRVAGSAYYINDDRNEAFTDIGNFAGTISFGVRDRAELFAGFQFYRRIDADRRPLFSIGTPVDYPRINDGWATGVGDVYLGAKVNITSQARQQPAAFAIRGIVKLPTASGDDGLGSGRPDLLLDAVISREVNDRVEVAGFGGIALRSSPDDFDVPAGFRYGFGVAVPTRQSLRLTAELVGEAYLDNQVTQTNGPLPEWPVKSPVEGFVGLDYRHPNGFFAGAGLKANFGVDPRSDYGGGATDEGGDNLGLQVRLGYHPGAGIYVPPPPPPPPAAPANRPPTVKARCEPCTVQIGRSSTVTADALDADGDALTYKWSAPSGAFANPGDRQGPWTAPEQEGAVPVTVTVDDGRGGTASDTVTIQVVRPPVREFRFEDVHFDFDRYSLRAEATRLLDEAVRALTENKELSIQIEGHTCSIGTAEYNLALGERRAVSVREYLVSRGIAASRLGSVSYGEERPKHDNSREETRRLNRRAALTVRIQ